MDILIKQSYKQQIPDFTFKHVHRLVNGSDCSGDTKNQIKGI